MIRKRSTGIAFSSKTILRIGVALLGARITFDEIQSLGLETIVMVTGGVSLTVLAGFWIGRGLRQSSHFSILSAGAVAICGASAALAISSVLPKDDKLEGRTISRGCRSYVTQYDSDDGLSGHRQSRWDE